MKVESRVEFDFGNLSCSELSELQKRMKERIEQIEEKNRSCLADSSVDEIYLSCDEGHDDSGRGR